MRDHCKFWDICNYWHTLCMKILLSYLRCIKGSDHLIIINCTSSIFDSYRGDLNKFVYYPSTVLRYLRQLLVTKLVIDILRFGEDWLFNFKDIQSSNMAYRLASKNRVEHNTMKNYETWFVGGACRLIWQCLFYLSIPQIRLVSHVTWLLLNTCITRLKIWIFIL